MSSRSVRKIALPLLSFLILGVLAVHRNVAVRRSHSANTALRPGLNTSSLVDSKSPIPIFQRQSHEPALSDAAQVVRQSVMLLLRTDGATATPIGTAFVISQRTRLLVTCAHLADAFFLHDSLLASPAGDTSIVYKVEGAWYHPNMRRVLDEGLVVRCTDPEGLPHPASPDLAVLKLSKRPPKFPDAVTLARPDELHSLLPYRQTGKLGFGGLAARGSSGVPSLSFAAGPVERVVLLSTLEAKRTSQRAGIQVGIPVEKGDSGGPIFLANGHVVAITVGTHVEALFGKRSDDGTFRKTSFGQPVDLVVQILNYHRLVDLQGPDWNLGPTSPLPNQGSDPQLEAARRALRLVRSAQLMMDRRELASALADCDEAVRLAPGYTRAYYLRAVLRTRLLTVDWVNLSNEARARGVDRALHDAEKCASLAERLDGGVRNVTQVQLLNHLTLLCLNMTKGDISNSFTCYVDVTRHADILLRRPGMKPGIAAYILGARARAWRKLAKLEDALSDVEKAIRLDFQNPYLFAERAAILDARRQTDLASQDRLTVEHLSGHADTWPGPLAVGDNLENTVMEK